MKRKNYYLIWCVLFIFLILPVQFGCEEAEDELQQEQTAITDFDPWVYDVNCNGQIDKEEVQAVSDDLTENNINETEFKAFTDLWISLNNDQEENSEKSDFDPCEWDANDDGYINAQEIIYAIASWSAGENRITASQIIILISLWSAGENVCSTFTVNWYGDQYLAISGERTSSGVQSNVTSAVQNIVNQTNLAGFDIIPHWNSWDSHFTVMTQLPHGEINDLLEELADEKPYDSKCNSVLGITYNRATDTNGAAYNGEPGSSCAVVDCDPAGFIVNWPDITLYMHELCHNLGANHCLGNCVMNKLYAPSGTTNICAGCRADINEYLNN